MVSGTPSQACEICGRNHRFYYMKPISKVKVNSKSNTSTLSQNSNRIYSRRSINTKLKKSNQTSCRSVKIRSAWNRKYQEQMRKSKSNGSTKSRKTLATKSNSSKGSNRMGRAKRGLDKISIDKYGLSNGSPKATQSLLRSVEKMAISSTFGSLPLNHTKNKQLMKPNQATNRSSRSQKNKRAWDFQIILFIKFLSILKTYERVSLAVYHIHLLKQLTGYNAHNSDCMRNKGSS